MPSPFTIFVATIMPLEVDSFVMEPSQASEADSFKSSSSVASILDARISFSSFRHLRSSQAMITKPHVATSAAKPRHPFKTFLSHLSRDSLIEVSGPNPS